MLDFEKLFPTRLARAVLWAGQQERYVLAKGVFLDQKQTEDAVRIGVRYTNSVRLLWAEQIPQPADGLLRQVNRQAGLTSPRTGGLTLGYGILLRPNVWGWRQMLAHELVHVTQYEQQAGIEGFLQKYIKEILTVGYVNSHMERDAVRISEDY